MGLRKSSKEWKNTSIFPEYSPELTSIIPCIKFASQQHFPESKLFSPNLGHSLFHLLSPVCLWWTRRWWTISLWSWEWRDTSRHCATSCWWRTASSHSHSAICFLRRWGSLSSVAVVSSPCTFNTSFVRAFLDSRIREAKCSDLAVKAIHFKLSITFF